MGTKLTYSITMALARIRAALKENPSRAVSLHPDDARAFLSLEPLEGQSKVGDGTPDAALAIGEHAFRAGFSVAASLTNIKTMSEHERALAAVQAWSEYDPPEDIKALA